EVTGAPCPAAGRPISIVLPSAKRSWFSLLETPHELFDRSPFTVTQSLVPRMRISRLSQPVFCSTMSLAVMPVPNWITPVPLFGLTVTWPSPELNWMVFLPSPPLPVLPKVMLSPPGATSNTFEPKLLPVIDVETVPSQVKVIGEPCPAAGRPMSTVVPSAKRSWFNLLETPHELLERSPLMVM